MRERATLWLRLGRLLPRSVRERIFEPAYYDLLADRLRRAQGRRQFELHMAWTTLECFRMGIRTLLVEERKPTRAAWILLCLLACSTVLVVVRASYAS